MVLPYYYLIDEYIGQEMLNGEPYNIIGVDSLMILPLFRI